MKKRKSFRFWLLAFLLTVVFAVYQRLSGPTHPVRGTETLEGAQIRYKLYRSWTTGQDLPVRVAITGAVAKAVLTYRRYPFVDGEQWTTTTLRETEGAFHGSIPGQPPAGKVAYKVDVSRAGKSLWLNSGRPVVARFKGAVPAALLIVHVIFMFAGLLLAFRTGLEALRREGREGPQTGNHWQNLVTWTLAVTFCGGLILGPLVQKYAFGAFWTGFPLGGDLTDSKTLFVVLVWLAAFFLRKKSRFWPLAATVLMIAVYLIPHSLLGSELDHKTGKVETAKSVRD